MVAQGSLLFILVQFKEHTMRCQQNIDLTVQWRISELYETCIPEHFYKNKEQLKEAIIFCKRLLWQVFCHWSTLCEVNIQSTLHQGLRP